jgi:hypothetical protein
MINNLHTIATILMLELQDLNIAYFNGEITRSEYNKHRLALTLEIEAL